MEKPLNNSAWLMVAPVLVLVLFFRPSGLLGKPEIE